jgi:hypothetical protein
MKSSVVGLSPAVGLEAAAGGNEYAARIRTGRGA